MNAELIGTELSEYNMLSMDDDVPLFTMKHNAVVEFESTWNSDK